MNKPSPLALVGKMQAPVSREVDYAALLRLPASLAKGGPVGVALSAFKSVVHPASDAGQLAVREILAVHNAPGKFRAGNDKLFRQHMITDETMTNASQDPTTTFHDPDTNEVVGAYQLGARPDGTYIPNIVAYKRGLGHQMLTHAKAAAPTKKVYLYAIPGSESTYRDSRQKAAGWTESNEDGVPMFTNESE